MNTLKSTIREEERQLCQEVHIVLRHVNTRDSLEPVHLCFISSFKIHQHRHSILPGTILHGIRLTPWLLGVPQFDTINSFIFKPRG